MIVTCVDYKPVDGENGSIYTILMQEIHVFELRAETKFAVWDPRSFFFQRHLSSSEEVWKIQKGSSRLTWSLNWIFSGLPLYYLSSVKKTASISHSLQTSIEIMLFQDTKGVDGPTTLGRKIFGVYYWQTHGLFWYTDLEGGLCGNIRRSTINTRI